MFYRVTINLNFKAKAQAEAFFKQAETASVKSHVVNPGTPAQEPSYVSLHECYHDLDPAQPCKELIFKGVTL